MVEEMKKFLIILLIIGINSAQDFLVEKISGDVLVQKGFSESWESVKVGDELSKDDLLQTEEKSYIQLNNSGNRFLLKGNSALGLNHIKEVSINELLLALAMEEIRKIPKDGKKNESRNTAVYGEEQKQASNLEIEKSSLGQKRLNGAKQLAEEGFEESAIIAAKETYRKYPETRKDVNTRLYFVDLLIQLELLEEANSELYLLKEFADVNQASIVDNKINEVKEKLTVN